MRYPIPAGARRLEHAPALAAERSAIALATILSGLSLASALRPATVGAPSVFLFALVSATAVGLSAWHGGVRVGLVGAALSAAVADYFFLPPFGAFGPLAPADMLRLVSFATAAALLSLLSGSLRASRRRAEVSAADAAALVAQLEEQAVELEQQVEESQALAEQLEEQEAELRETKAHLEQLLDASPTVLYTTRITGDVVTPTWVSSNIGRVMGYSVDEALDPVWWPTCLHPDDRPAILAEGVDFRRGAVWEYRFRHKDGSYRWVRDEARPTPEADDGAVELVGSWADITERKRSEEELERQRALFEAVLRQIPGALVIAEAPSGRLILANQQVERFLRRPVLTAAAIEQHSEYTGCHPDGRELRPEEWPLARAISTGEVVTDEEIRLLRGDGSVGVGLFSAAPVRDRRGDIVAGVVAWSDITERKRMEEQLKHQASHDALTGLANRALLRERVEHALTRVARGENIAVLFLDLDNFKMVNDSLGHAEGDRLLVAVAQRLLRATRGCDTVARLGGDEFAVLLEGVAKREDAQLVVERITASMLQPVIVRGREVSVRASIGVAHALGGEDADELLRNADLAMYRAKASGKGRHEVFEPTMHQAALERLELEADLRQALQRGEFRLLYQPIVELASGQVRAVEALVRWEHPERGLLSPASFIPTAEEAGLIVPLGRWVLQEACRQLRGWQMCAPAGSTLDLSVNISSRQLQDPALLDDVAGVLADTAVEPHRLTLEITESVIMQDTEATLRKLHQLKALGVQLAVDDFGTGYSSLSYLQRFPVDVLKIDKAFVSGISRDASHAALTRTIIALAEMLELRTVAEGVEQADQRGQLVALGCVLGQGYLFARALSADQVDALLRSAGVASIGGPSL